MQEMNISGKEQVRKEGAMINRKNVRAFYNIQHARALRYANSALKNQALAEEAVGVPVQPTDAPGL